MYYIPSSTFLTPFSGKATVLGLAAHNAKVYIGARSAEKANEAIKEIAEQLPSADVKFVFMDLGNLRSVVGAAQEIRKKETVLHGLVNNAGIMGVPFSRTTDGYEIQFQVPQSLTSRR